MICTSLYRVRTGFVQSGRCPSCGWTKAAMIILWRFPALFRRIFCCDFCGNFCSDFLAISWRHFTEGNYLGNSSEESSPITSIQRSHCSCPVCRCRCAQNKTNWRRRQPSTNSMNIRKVRRNRIVRIVQVAQRETLSGYAWPEPFFWSSLFLLVFTM